jgi:hypothetical protein
MSSITISDANEVRARTQRRAEAADPCLLAFELT